MAKVLDVQSLVDNQTESQKQRRVSQYVNRLNSTPVFVTLYNINKEATTTEYTTNTIDEYIGPRSPVRFDKVENFPLYGGFAEITTQVEFDEELGSSSESYEGESVVVPNTLIPYEGSAFIMNAFDRSVLFVITNVRYVDLRSKPHYVIEYTITEYAHVAEIEKQVVDNFTTIFDNIGTENKSVIKTEEFDICQKLSKEYERIHNYYLKKFYSSQTSTLETNVTFLACPDDSNRRLTDKHLMKFLKENRVIYMDEVLGTFHMFDNNVLESDDDFEVYPYTIYYALKEHRMDLLEGTTHVECNIINSKFALSNRYSDAGDLLYSVDKFINFDTVDDLENRLVMELDMNTLVEKIKHNDISDITTTVGKYSNVLIKYMNNTQITADDVKDLHLLRTDDINKLIFLPMILFIISKNIDIYLKESTVRIV